MASELQVISLDKIKAVAERHATTLVGLSVGVGSILLFALTWALLTSRSDVVPTMTCSKSGAVCNEAGSGAGTTCSGDSCPWQYVLSDLTNRLHLLEAAFKEQVLARELMAQEVSNQSDSNLMIEQKLLVFIRRLEEVENMVKRVEYRVNELSARLYSDEFIGFVVIVAIMVEVLLRVRPRVGHFRPFGSDIIARYRRWSQGRNDPLSTEELTTTAAVTPAANVAGSRLAGEAKEDTGQEMTHTQTHSNGTASPQVLKSTQANGVSFSPKHGLFLKAELCVIAFRRDHSGLTAFIDTTLRHLDDIKLSVKPYYVIESHDHLRQCPRAKLYLVIFEMEERVSSGPVTQDSDLITSTVRYVKSLKANLILIVTNDEGSRKLTVHALYNTHLRLLQSHEAFQDLTSSGRVFSTWRELTSHQTSHLRKIVKTALNHKLNLR